MYIVRNLTRGDIHLENNTVIPINQIIKVREVTKELDRLGFKNKVFIYNEDDVKITKIEEVTSEEILSKETVELIKNIPAESYIKDEEDSDDSPDEIEESEEEDEEELSK